MRSIKQYLFTAIIIISIIVPVGCSLFGPDVVDIDVVNNSSYNLTNVVLSTGYTDVLGDPEYTNSLSLGTVSAGASSLDNTVPIDAGEGDFESIQMSFEIDGTPYSRSDTFLYTYTHVTEPTIPGVMTTRLSPWPILHIPMKAPILLRFQ
ncbi:MAG: hypothetical protein ACLFST_14820 [Spirochaetia bacterium]